MWSPVSLRIFGQRDDLVALAGCCRGCRGRSGSARRSGRGGRSRWCRRRRGRCGRSRRRRRGPVTRVLVDVIEHVFARDATARAGATDRRRIEAVLGDETAHDRRQKLVARCLIAAAAAGRRRDCGSRRGCGDRCSRGGRCRRGRRRGGRGFRRGLCRWRSGGRCRCSRRSAGRVRDDGDQRADVDGVALVDLDLGEEPRGGRRHLCVDLVGGHLEQRLVDRDRVTHLLEPLGDRALGDRLTELGHRDVGHQPCRLLPVMASTLSPNSSDSVGCGWMKCATSSTVASQFTAR